ncbi:MAG: diguanylate cyclase domain-containing protein [Deltaproteobacteria bacterium]
MGISRILVVQEEAGPSRNLQFTVFGNPVEFDFRTPKQALGLDYAPYRAIATSFDSAGNDLMETLRRSPEEGPPVFLFRGTPPLHEIARWIAWPTAPGADDPSVTDRLLSENIEYYSLASLYQQCLKITATQDEENLMNLVSDTFCNAFGVENCVTWLASQTDPDEMTIASVRGLTNIDKEGSRIYVSQSEWSEAIAKGEPFLAPVPASDAGAGTAAPAGQVLYVPLVHREKTIGLVKIGERNDKAPFSERDRYIARIIADYSASAWRNLSRILSMERFSLRDRETKAYSEAFLYDYFDKERFKASRCQRPISVVQLVFDNLSLFVEQTRESFVAGVLAEIVEGIRTVLRDSDFIARIEQSRFCIVLPETDYFGSILAMRRLRRAIKARSTVQFLGNQMTLSSFLASATFPRDGKNLQELLKATDTKCEKQNRSPFQRMHLEEKPLWNAFDVLVGKPEYYESLQKGKEVPYFLRIRRMLGRNSHFRLPGQMFLRMVESVAQDVITRVGDRGLVIVAGPRPEIYKQIFLSFGPDAPPGKSIYLVGQSGSTRFDSKNLLYVTASDGRLATCEVVLYLKDNGAYGLFSRDRKDEVFGFNTADEWLIDIMMEKVQDAYRLQGGF